jgi:hypothetical protein
MKKRCFQLIGLMFLLSGCVSADLGLITAQANKVKIGGLPYSKLTATMAEEKLA